VKTITLDPWDVATVGRPTGEYVRADVARALYAALQSFLRMNDRTTEISGGEWSAAVVMGRAAVAEADAL
jgi:hypothetical protein